jgi:di/tripeptidase
VDFGIPSAIHELAELVTQISALELPEDPRTTLNVGVITGGTSVNTIAAEASLQLDLRSAGRDALSTLIKQVENLVEEANYHNMTFRAEIIGQRPAGELPTDHPLVKLACDILESYKIKPNLNIGSTDANIPLSQGLPSVCIGLTKGSGAHTVNEYIQTRPLEVGLAQLYDLVIQAFQTL